MFLKRLTMKGFKSFADTTVLEFEPGVTAVVGPNGSGKSNVVDAVTWVLGAQSTRALRSSRMEDVIFVGTASRPALGRAEVALTLDNASGKLPIDGAEVTISRTLFRSGESEYAINATPCRLLDIQELLGDSGVGRQQHMIIGQGQLDSVLNARPEDRRSVVEEAAGVLKHRRRKERAERRLTQTQENLERLGDLVREVRRQMRPLERQAAAARSYSDVESELRQVRRFSLSVSLDENNRRRRELDERLRGAGQRERELRHELVTLDAQATAAASEVASRREELLASTLGALQGLAERARGLSGVIGERRGALRAALAASADENVIATLEADAARLAADLAHVADGDVAIDEARREAMEAATSLGEAEQQFDATWGPVLEANEEADLRSSVQHAELLRRSLHEAERQRERADARARDALERRGNVTERREAADGELAVARAAATQAQRALDEIREQSRVADEALELAATAWRESAEAAAHASARSDALARALVELSGSGASQVVAELAGVIGPLLELVDVDPGAERAVESAAGAAAGAVVVDGRNSAREALAALRESGDSGSVLPVSEITIDVPPTPAHCEPLRELVRARGGAPAHVSRVLDALFARAFVAPNFDVALDTAAAHPELVIVTRAGDRLAASGWRVSSGRSVVTRSAVDEAARDARTAQTAVPERRRDRDECAARAATARAAVESALATARSHDAAVDRLLSELEALSRQIDGLVAGAEAAEIERTTAVAMCDQLASELADADAQVATNHDRVNEAAQRTAWANEARATLEAHRAQVTERERALARREAEHAERRRLLEARRREVEARLEGHTAERAEAAGRRERLEADLRALDRLEAMVERASGDIRVCQDALGETYREQLESSRAGAERLEELRRQRGAAEARLSELSDLARKDEIESAELAVRLTALHDDVRRELNEEPDEVVGASAPELPEGVTVAQRLAELEARISSLGPINPLALEELSALEDRYKDLDAQVSDVRHARRELLEVVRALDEEIMQTFSSAIADVNEHFSTLISMLFPGGQGRLILTAPDDPLNTGVEIEVRPMGRNVRRISLLSGGERSMAALAFLFAVFRSRPSPFYMMDEVEAALDDVNLQRFLSLVDEFRNEAQLLIVTHQKRTMEAADALYGVTMAPGGSSKVVSQRVNRHEGLTE